MRDSRPKVLFLTSPNNPDGSMITEAELLELLELPVRLLSLRRSHQRRHWAAELARWCYECAHISLVCCSCFLRMTPVDISGKWAMSFQCRSINVLLTCRQVLVVLDEAYIEFSEEPSRLGWPARYDNLVVLRTFSKSAGLAGEHVMERRSGITAAELCACYATSIADVRVWVVLPARCLSP